MAQQVDISKYTADTLALPLEVSTAHLGAKASGKSVTLAAQAVHHALHYGDKARALIVRQSFPSLEQLRGHITMLLAQLYGGTAAAKMYLQRDNVFTLPGGGRIELGHTSDGPVRYIGRSVTFLGQDEAGTYTQKDIECVDLIRTNSRCPAGVIYKESITANPGSAAHYYLQKHFWHDHDVPFLHNGKIWVCRHSVAADNPFIDQQSAYDAVWSLPDKQLASALWTGDWTSIKSGEHFGGVWRPDHSVIEQWRTIPPGVKVLLGIDQGGGASSTYAMLVGIAQQTVVDPNDGTTYPKGSRFLISERSDATEDYQGCYAWPISQLAEHVIEMCEQYKVRPKGVIDLQANQRHGHQSTLLQEWSRCGVTLSPWKAHRRNEKAALVSQYMAGAAPPGQRETPGLYVCADETEGWQRTVPFLPTDKNTRDAPQAKGVFDHAYDAAAGAMFYATSTEATAEVATFLLPPGVQGGGGFNNGGKLFL